MKIVSGYETNDTICVADSNDRLNLKCSLNRRLIVITEQNNFNYPNIDGIVGISRTN